MEARSSRLVTAIAARETKRITSAGASFLLHPTIPWQIAMEARVLQEAAGKDRFLLGPRASKDFHERNR